MKTTQNQTVVRSVAIIGVAIALVVFLAGAYGPLPVASGQGRPSDPATPAASIDKIVVGGKSEIQVFDNVIVTRANGEKIRAVTTGLLLYPGDTIETVLGTQVTVLFLDLPVPEKHNQIIIDGDARVSIGSADSWWGRVWTKVSGLFTSKTTYVKVGATGTEYELNVSKDERQTTLVMLEGRFLDVTRGTFDLAGQRASIGPVQRDVRTTTPQFITTSFDRERSTQEQVGRALDVRAGELTPFDVTYNITNGCRQRHRFEFRTSDNTPWLQLEVQKIWEIAPNQTRAIPARLNIDARQMAAGAYRGHVYLVCLDCNQEASCPGSQLDWPYYVTVSGTTPPRPSPTPPPRNFQITELQEVVIPNSPESATPQRTSDERVRAVLEWTNGVILKTQPTYSAEGLFPHFAAVEQRSQNFRTAREQAILRHLPGSNKVLGDIYSDWGQAAQAAKAYEIERNNPAGPRGPSESFSVDQAEAQRLIGKPDQAREMVMASVDSKSAAAQNLLGNVYADYARIALDKKDWARARTDLDTAEGFYRSALSSPAPGRPRAAAADGTVQANLAKTQVLQGDLLLVATPGSQIGAAQQARTRYASAVQLLSTTQPAETAYPFGVQNLGRAHQGLGDAAMLAGEPAAALDSYANAKAHYNRVISAHPDCAEAYFSLGDLYEDMGDKENAKLNYRRAIQTRPEQPASYYPLALLLQTEDPQLAKALAATYLKLEPEVFKQGEKARNAERITRGETVPPTTRIGTTKPTGIEVPGVVSMTRNEAVNKLTTAGFVVNVQTRNDPQFGNVVLEQNPAGGSPAQRGSTVDIVVNNPIRQLIVPNVIAKSEPDARAAIESVGLRVGNVGRRVDPSKAVGTVLEQRPAAGSSAERGSVIEIVVSGGEPVVPNVVTMSETDARTAIENVGLRVGEVKTRSEDNKPKGSVVKQEPSAGRKVAAGSSVSLTVSAGKLVDIPKIINDKVETARKKITDKHLRVGSIGERAVSQREGTCESVGKVLEQNPNPSREKVEVGTTVDFVIGSVGENPVTVPNFVGSNGRDVQGDIRGQRFTVPKLKTEETDDAPPGTVIKQSPPAGTQFAQECPVKLELTVATPLTTVGNYVGLTEGEARQQVSGTGLSAVVRTREIQGQPGMVIDQSPPAGSRVRRSYPITLVVSVLPVQLIPVPGVTTKHVLEAKSILEGAGLRLGTITYEESQPSVFIAGRGGTDVPECTVTRQDPIKDSQVRPGTPVNVWVMRLKGSNRNCLNPNRGDGDH